MKGTGQPGLWYQLAMLLALALVLGQDPAQHIEVLLQRQEFYELGVSGCGLQSDKAEAQEALRKYPRDEVLPYLELGVDRISKLDPPTAYLAHWVLEPYAEIGKEKALPRLLDMHRSGWEPEIVFAIKEAIAKAAGITAYVTSDSPPLPRPGDGLPVFCTGDSPRHAFHRALREHFRLRKFTLGFRLESWDSEETFRLSLELYDSKARACGPKHDVAFTKSTVNGRPAYLLRTDIHDGAVVAWELIEKCAAASN